MKRTIRSIALVVAAVGIAYWVMEKLGTLPKPDTEGAGRWSPAAEPPPAAPSVPQPPQMTREQPEDDLSELKGIGPVYSDRLNANGVRSFRELAAADADELAEAIDVSPTQVRGWQVEAGSRS